MAPLDGNENCIGKKQRDHIVCCGGKYMIVYLNMLDILNFFNNLNYKATSSICFHTSGGEASAAAGQY